MTPRDFSDQRQPEAGPRSLVDALSPKKRLEQMFQNVVVQPRMTVFDRQANPVFLSVQRKQHAAVPVRILHGVIKQV